MSEIFENEELLEEDEGIITLEDENGETVDFEFGDMIDYKGNSYAVLIPLDEEDTDIIIMQVEAEDEDTGDTTLGPVEDEKLLNEVFEIFIGYKILIDNVYTFLDVFNIILCLCFPVCESSHLSRYLRHFCRYKTHFGPGNKLLILLYVMTHLAECPHDKYTLLLCEFSSENRCEHIDSLFGEGMRHSSTFRIYICGHKL